MGFTTLNIGGCVCDGVCIVSDNWLVTFDCSKVFAPMTGKGVCPAKRGRSCTGFDVTGKDMRYWINSLAQFRTGSKNDVNNSPW